MKWKQVILWCRYLWLLFLAVYLFVGSMVAVYAVAAVSIIILFPLERDRWIQAGVLDIAVLCLACYLSVRTFAARNPIAGMERCCSLIIATNTYLLIRWYGRGILRCLKSDSLFPILVWTLLAVFGVCFYMHVIGARGADFAEIYHLRHLLRPGGWLINAWGTLWLLLLPIVIIRNRHIFVFSLLICGSLLLSFSRSAYICLAMFAVVLVVSLRKRREIRKFLAGAVCAVVFAVALFPQEVVTTVSFRSNESQTRSMEWRVNSTNGVMALVRERPLSGFGVSRYSEVTEARRGFDTRSSFTTTAPNIASLLVLESGVAGLGLFAVVVAIGLCVSAKSRSVAGAVCLAGIAAFMAKEMSQSFIPKYPLLLTMFFLLLAIPRQTVMMRIRPMWLMAWLTGAEVLVLVVNAVCLRETQHYNDPMRTYIIGRQMEQSGDVRQAKEVFRQLCDDYPDNALFLYRLGASEYSAGNENLAFSLFIEAIDHFPRLLCLDEFKQILASDSALTEKVKSVYSGRMPSDMSDPVMLASNGFVCYCLGIKQGGPFLTEAVRKLPNLSTPWFLLGDMAKFDFLSVGYSAGVVTNRATYSPLRELSEVDIIEITYGPQATLWYGDCYKNYNIKMTEKL